MIAYAVAVRREDGIDRLAIASNGTGPHIWDNKHKHHARIKAERLRRDGLNARVVRVEYTEPRIVDD